MFRPNGAHSLGEKSKISPPKKTSCKTVSLEKGDSKKTKGERLKQEVIIGKNEKKLVKKYSDYLSEKKFGVLKRNQIDIKNENTIYTDGWIEKKRLLIEAKANSTREKIRMAIGQLLDYERHVKPKPKKLAVLIPKKPREDLIHLLEKLEIMIIYPAGKEFVHHEKTSPHKTSP